MDGRKDPVGAGDVAHAMHSPPSLVGGEVMCWGNNQYGQLGNGGTVGSTHPVQVTGIPNATQISGGGSFSAASTACTAGRASMRCR